MTHLAVFDGDAAGWRVPREDLLAAFQRDWPDVDLRHGNAADVVRDVVGTYVVDGEVGEVNAHQDGTCLYIDGGLRSAAAFAVCYRRLVPSHIDLILCDEVYHFDVAVVPDMTMSELVARVDGVA
jgi:hypothetical protein